MTTQQGGLYRIPEREATANHLYGAVDLGSNTFRLLITRIQDGHCQPLLKEMRTVRLGEALHRTGMISDQAIDRGTKVLTDFKALLDWQQLKAVRVCGTAALRMAANSEQFLQQATTILGTGVEVIEGEQEARLSAIGAFAAMKKEVPQPSLLTDIGGGSSELMLTAATQTTPEIVTTVSLPLGAVTLSETFLHGELPATEELAAMATHIESVLDPALTAMRPLPATLLGIGGTATALAALDCNLSAYDSDRVQDYRLSLTSLTDMLARLSRLTGKERNQLPGLADGRGEIIIGGLMILITLLKRVSCTALIVSDGGLLEGIALSAAARCGNF